MRAVRDERGATRCGRPRAKTRDASAIGNAEERNRRDIFCAKSEGKSEKIPIALSLPITYTYRPSCAIVRFGTRGLRRHMFSHV